MLKDRTVFVVVPCYNEETQIARVVETMPAFVDRIVIVDDCSRDRTREVVRELERGNSRVTLIAREKNGGVGAAIADGYRYARDQRADVTAVMAGDGQMDPADLERVVTPVLLGYVDYCKGNRFRYRGGLQKIPYVRKFGNFVLSALTKIASGYWHTSDSQTGYTAIALDTLADFDIDGIYHTYGVPNDILVKLNIIDARVGEVPVNPLYGIGERSKLRPTKVALPILRLLLTLWFKRVVRKYIVQNGHPIVGVLCMGTLFSLLFALTFFYIAVMTVATGIIPKAALIVDGVAFITAAQFLLTAMHMDYQYNERLCVLLDRLDAGIPRRHGAHGAAKADNERPAEEARKGAEERGLPGTGDEKPGSAGVGGENA